MIEINYDLIYKIKDYCVENNLKISAAESMTGGLFASSITSVSGASAFFDRAYITYSNEAKESMLDVSFETIDKYGAISKETALEMVNGLRIYSMSDICIAITGNAGPNPAENKAVGEYYVSLIYNNSCKVLKFNSSLNFRNEIQIEGVNNMLSLIYTALVS